jgi:hypothetical protein
MGGWLATSSGGALLKFNPVLQYDDVVFHFLFHHLQIMLIMTKTFLAHLALAANPLIPAYGTAQWVENDTVFVMLQSGRKMAIGSIKTSPSGPAATMPTLS